MDDYGSTLFKCDRWEDVGDTLDRFGAALPLDVRKRVNRVFVDHVMRFDLEGTFARLNNKTVAQILAEPVVELEQELPVVATGELDGVKWCLYDAPKEEGKDRVRPEGEVG
jgi:hypothetical protein